MARKVEELIRIGARFSTHKLLEQAGVAVTPGIDFGCHNAQRYLRFAYTTSQENLKEGIERLRRFMK